MKNLLISVFFLTFFFHGSTQESISGNISYFDGKPFVIRKPVVLLGSGNFHVDFISGYNRYIEEFYGKNIESCTWVGLSIVTSKGRITGMKHARKVMEIFQKTNDESLFKKAVSLSKNSELSENELVEKIKQLLP